MQIGYRKLKKIFTTFTTDLDFKYQLLFNLAQKSMEHEAYFINDLGNFTASTTPSIVIYDRSAFIRLGTVNLI